MTAAIEGKLLAGGKFRGLIVVKYRDSTTLAEQEYGHPRSV
jgi:hypothetical protein